MLRRRKSKQHDAALENLSGSEEGMVRIIRPNDADDSTFPETGELAPTQPSARPDSVGGSLSASDAPDLSGREVGRGEERQGESAVGVSQSSVDGVANSWDSSGQSASAGSDRSAVALDDTGAWGVQGPAGIDPMLPSPQSDPAPESHDQSHVGGSGIRVVPVGEGLSTPNWLQTGTEDEPDETSARRTVVISDDGSASVAPATGGSARRGMDPRIRARRRAVRRAFGRKRLVWLSVAAVVVVVVLIGGALLGSRLFAVHKDQIVVTGWVYADPTRMNQVLDELAGTPVLRVDEDSFAERFESVPRVLDARVNTHLPNAATVEIRERTPLTTFMGPDGRFRILDREGRVIDIIDGMPIEFVWITTDTPPTLELGDFAPAGLAAASEMTRNFTPTVRPRVRRIAVEPSGSALVLYFRDGTRVNFGSAKDLFSKLVRLETLLTDYPDMTDAQIDVSTADTTRASADLLKIAQAQAAAAEAQAEASQTSEPASDSGTTDESAPTTTTGSEPSTSSTTATTAP